MFLEVKRILGEGESRQLITTLVNFDHIDCIRPTSEGNTLIIFIDGYQMEIENDYVQLKLALGGKKLS